MAALILLIGAVPSAPASAATQAGVAAAVSGQITIQPEDRSATREAASGMPIFVQDTIRSREASQMQVLLLDETVLTVGPNTEVQIDDMVYDPAAAGNSKLTAKISNGVFGYISGRIAETRPENVEINVPVGTIGVRGTSIFGVQDPATGKTFIGLLGPGPHNDAKLRTGGFTLTNQFGSTEVLRSGFGIFADNSGPPGPPTPIPAQFLNVLLNQLRNGLGTGGGGNRGGGNAPNQSGHTAALVLKNADSTDAINSLSNQIADDTANAAQHSQQVVLTTLTRLQGPGESPGPAVVVPLLAGLIWSGPTALNLGMVITGPTLNGTPFRVANAINLGNFFNSPFVRIDGATVGTSGVLVSQFNGLTPGGNYNVSAFDFNAAANNFGTFGNAANNIAMVFVQGGSVTRGAGGTANFNGGTPVLVLTPPVGSVGDTWNAAQINPTTRTVSAVGTVTTNNTIANVH
ncbi:MAG TPA: FecR domain-containing protein [Candidatus Cybelea sp.]|nr:FecR domain-containing protein [Candidatus Cybelea sp.]